ncbi:MAG: hypothetical protein K6F51_02015 [Acetatifactor sp.]|nr:hypothetical protein [Acetatifactor sp.]
MKKKIVITLNLLIVACTLVGLWIMLDKNGNNGGVLATSGWNNLRYFTVQSNILCGIVAAIYLVSGFLRGHGKSPASQNVPASQDIPASQDVPASQHAPATKVTPCPAWMMTLKLAATAAVMVTFLVVACFFGPLYGYGKLYLGSNLFFHLIIPLLGMIEFCLLDGTLPFRNTFPAGSPALIYGCVYLANILINGKGEWPNTNDWYGFMNWGAIPAALIFSSIVLTDWGVACLLRWINHLINKLSAK